MIQKLEIHGVHVEVDPSLKKYITKKIGNLYRCIPKNERESAHAEVFLKTTKEKGSRRNLCEVTLRVPHQTIVIQEYAQNMFAAVDIAEEKLKQQLTKHKERTTGGSMRRRVFQRFGRRKQSEVTFDSSQDS
jgi:ribosomal subunit interface protein